MIEFNLALTYLNWVRLTTPMGVLPPAMRKFDKALADICEIDYDSAIFFSNEP